MSSVSDCLRPCRLITVTWLLAACAHAPPPGAKAEALPPLPARLSQPLPPRDMAALGPAPAGKAAQLAWVQRRLNNVPFRTDRALWGREDYWAAPEAFLARGGDCEDYALAKMAVLRSLGWREEDMELLLVADTARADRAHAVLRARLGQTAWLLDNQSHDLRPAAREARYRPLYGTNALAGHWY